MRDAKWSLNSLRADSSMLQHICHSQCNNHLRSFPFCYLSDSMSVTSHVVAGHN